MVARVMSSFRNPPAWRNPSIHAANPACASERFDTGCTDCKRQRRTNLSRPIPSPVTFARVRPKCSTVQGPQASGEPSTFSKIVLRCYSLVLLKVSFGFRLASGLNSWLRLHGGSRRDSCDAVRRTTKSNMPLSHQFFAMIELSIIHSRKRMGQSPAASLLPVR